MSEQASMVARSSFLQSCSKKSPFSMKTEKFHIARVSRYIANIYIYYIRVYILII